MKRALLLAAVAVAVSSTLTTAQTSSEKKPTRKNTITVTGCLQSGAASDTFMLSNVTQGSAATGTTGTPSSTSASKATESTYELVASSGVDLKPHVGHKVEVTGTPADMKGTTGTSGTSSTAGTKKLSVTAIKHIAGSCS